MMLVIPQVLDAAALAQVRALLEAPQAEWVDGRATAGHQGALVKVNQQLDERGEAARRAQAIVEATTHFEDAERIAHASRGLGEAMAGLEIGPLEQNGGLLQHRGW